eukprot:gene9564-19870_t
MKVFCTWGLSITKIMLLMSLFHQATSDISIKQLNHPYLNFKAVVVQDTNIFYSSKGLVWIVAALYAVNIGNKLEKTMIGKRLSGPVCSMLVSALLTNANIVPSNSVHVQLLSDFAVKLATPLLLFGADIRKVIKETGRFFVAYALGAVGSIAGSLLSYKLFRPALETIEYLGDEDNEITALVLNSIGGGFKFKAIAELMQLSPPMISLGLA